MSRVDSVGALLAMSAADDEAEFALARLAAIRAGGLGSPLPELSGDVECAVAGPGFATALALGCPVQVGADGGLEHQAHGPLTVATRIKHVTQRRAPVGLDAVPMQVRRGVDGPAFTVASGGGRTSIRCAVCGPLQAEDSQARAEYLAGRHNRSHQEAAVRAEVAVGGVQ